ncbi:Uncharacterized protein OS=Cyanothece sp. (strain ATCC 51142) GN=cce_3069 PE=4 SV=1: DUF3102 [Gemmataceae bacterium]|nr:Uncharacterized protein OS=Cyanothece sp. (strain ATCC 51142) GN=cce_3069 PE=4 SV=1: DUF3102 [Gemmataceae bacterium]VTT96583.1 Uncharacterized protein OS=Cyanothece sp. (strain ATCC 51142) GN=cce_3069 PE=4 SV=1: DUF3102 [Gemmataceae bacterium]
MHTAPTPPGDAALTPAVAFSYSALPAGQRDWFRAAAGQVRALAYRTACDMIRVGLLLADARGRVKRRTFRAWLAAELPWSRSHAYRLIQVGQAFGPLVDATRAERIDPTALYLLARPEVPAGARKYAVELAGNRPVTAADAREILEAHRWTPDPTRDEVKAHEGVMKPVRDAERAAERAAAGPGGEARQAAAWRALQALVAGATVVHVAAIVEDDGPDAGGDDPLYSVTVYAEGDRPRNVVRRGLADVIGAAAGLEPEKVCPGCQESKPLGLFSRNRKMADGANRYCKACERSRLAALKKKRREQKRAGP